jgi:hypothetical protein
MSRFTITRHKGFRLVFNNGFAISVQWGDGNYCTRRNDGELNPDFVSPKESDFWTSDSAEVAVFDKKGKMMSLGEDTVAGWLSSDQVANLIAIVSFAKTKRELNKRIKALKL